MFCIPKVLAKKKAAIEFCSNHELEYILIDPPILSFSEIKSLYLEKKLQFVHKYELKWLKLMSSSDTGAVN